MTVRCRHTNHNMKFIRPRSLTTVPRSPRSESSEKKEAHPVQPILSDSALCSNNNDGLEMVEAKQFEAEVRKRLMPRGWQRGW